MQYSPKLKTAMEQVKSILAEHDIAGIVVLHTPGHCEYLVNIEPSYSCAFMDGAMLRIKAKLTDFDNDKDALQLTVTSTANMLQQLSFNTAKLSLGLLDASKLIDDLVGADHQPGGETSHTEQNN